MYTGDSQNELRMLVVDESKQFGAQRENPSSQRGIVNESLAVYNYQKVAQLLLSSLANWKRCAAKQSFVEVGLALVANDINFGETLSLSLSLSFQLP